MYKNKKLNNKIGVEADASVCPASKARQNNGITLIALVITIIVMLILVAVTISMAINGGLFEKAGEAVGDTKNELNKEQELANGRIQIDGTWYDSIDDYLNEKPSSPVKINLSIAGTKSTTVPSLDGFEHVEGTKIETGYVIRNTTDGNEFVWVPVDKDQKITLKITSEKDVTGVKLYDPYGDEILSIGNEEIEKEYNNTNINPTINGMYTAQITTEDGVTEKTLTVRSLYAVDAYNWYRSDEYVKAAGYSSKEEMYQAWANEDGYGSIEEMLQDWGGYSTIGEYERDNSHMKEYEDLADYTESVNRNGGFFVGRYEAGATTARTSGNSGDTVDAIKTANGTPVSKEGYVPYNWVTFDQALGLAESMYSSSEFTVSLLTGSAWDRTLGWIYETEVKNIKEIVVDSKSWGNYKDAEFEITKGKYSENGGSSYTEVSGTYKKTNGKKVLLTTGATSRNSANNIFDLAGNINEWTNVADSSNFRVRRGGNYNLNGGDHPASNRSYYDAGTNSIGFRPALYIK